MLQVLEREKAPMKPTNTEAHELSWFAERVKRGEKEIFSEVATITPSIARHILENNKDNRLISSPLVANIANDIAEGRWEMNGEAIIISNTGLLNDGQHRLNAVIEANRPIRTTITFGVPRKTRFTVDMGRARTTGDFLGMEGAKNRHRAAAGALLVGLWQKGVYGRHGAVRGTVYITRQGVRQIYWGLQKQFDAACEFVESAAFLKRWAPATSVAAYVILHQINNVEATVFFHHLRDGDDLKRNDPILVLRAHLLANERLASHEKLELFFRYWNAWRNGQKLERRISLRGTHPEISR